MNTASSEKMKRTTLIQAAKGLGVLALLIVLMMWLAGTFVEKVEPGPPAPKPQPPKVSTQKVERQVYPLTIDQVVDQVLYGDKLYWGLSDSIGEIPRAEGEEEIASMFMHSVFRRIRI